ncbi:hypothetical protein SAMN05660748_1943 [Blastococcus aggregatus]|uniref:Uncharacterized protein n=1 Tax=Blastococcus aggregatus TaxID=38502 RepID=A0A285V517_9ACTN|nr:hypothetical protein [Blastococcus aggregatus]SOC49224.1 hypothetical protein SAMN05660748_1943 [Blastococcus aggregatus]
MNTSDLRDELRRDAELAGLPPTDLVHRVAGLRRRGRRRWATALACACAVAVAVAGVSTLDGAREQDRSADGGAAATAVVDPEAAAEAYREVIANRGGGGSRAIAPASLVEFLPTITYLIRNGSTTSLSDAVVVGHVTSVGPGRAFYVPEDDDTASIEVPFDDPRAMWRTVHAEVAVTEVLAGEVPGNTVTFGLSLSPQTPVEVPVNGLPALGDLVLFLNADSGVFDYEPGIWSIVFDGEVLAEIADDGRLSLPAAEPYFAERWLAATPTLDSLREAARQPARVVPFESLED